MKTKLILLIGLLLFSTQTFAGGTEAGSGGWALIQDNEVILADPFFKVPNYDGVGERWMLNPELKSYLEHISDLLGTYGIPKVYLDEVLEKSRSHHLSYPIDDAEIKKRTERFGSLYKIGSPFWYDNVFSEQTEYRYTEELPCNDTFEFVSDVAGEPVLLGCTQENITWFKKSIFERLNLKNQALAIIHERLHSQTPKSHRVISDFVSILDLMLTLQNNQLKGELRPLTEEELNIISHLKERAQEMGFYTHKDTVGETLTIWPNGGGIITKQYFDFDKNDYISKTAFVGIGSNLDFCDDSPYVDDHVIIINSQLRCLKEIGNNTLLKNVSIIKNYSDWAPPHISIGSHSTLENVFFEGYTSASIGQNSHLENINSIDTGNAESHLVFKNNVGLANISLQAKSRDHDAWDLLIVPFFARINRNAWLTFKSGTNIDLSDAGRLRIYFDVGDTNISSKEDLLKLKGKER